MQNKTKYSTYFFVFFLLCPAALFSRDGVVVRITKAGSGATEEQAARMHLRLLQSLHDADYVDVRDDAQECATPCESMRYILASEVRVQEGVFALYIHIYDTARGIASNTHALRVKDALFDDLLDLVTSDYVKNLFVFQESGGYRSIGVVEKKEKSEKQ